MKRFLFLVLLLGVLAVGSLEAFAPHLSPLAPEADMPPRAEDAPAGSFRKLTRPDLETPTRGPFVYQPSARSAAAAAERSALNRTALRRWRFYAPAGGTGPMPLVILFHGAGRTGLSMIDMWLDVADRHGLALVAPDAPLGGWPFKAPDAAFARKLVERAGRETAIDRSRVFLFGHSNGGVYAHILTNRTSGPWRAAATHGGFAPPQFLQAPAEAKPFRMYLGTAEHICPPDAAEAVGRAMAKAGHAVDLVIIPYHTHWFYDAGPKIAEDAWRWFEGIGG
ncbi:MAG: hypothetical protein AAGF90_05690, partial [Pseudomonadota bacterium]